MNTEPPPAPYSAQGLGVNAEAPPRRPSAPAESRIPWQRPLQVQPSGQSNDNRSVSEHGLHSPSEINNNGSTIEPWKLENSLSRQQRSHQNPLTPSLHSGMQSLQPQINGRRQSYPYYYPPYSQQEATSYRVSGLPRSPPDFLSITRPLFEAVEHDDFIKFALLGESDGSTGEQGLLPPQRQLQQTANDLPSNYVPALHAHFSPKDPTAPRTLAGSVRPSLQYDPVPRTSSSRQPLRSSSVALPPSQVDSQPQHTQGPAVQQWDLRSKYTYPCA